MRQRRPVFLLRSLLLLVAALPAACGDRKLPGAVGPNDEISVFTNVSRDGAVASHLRRLFAYPVEVVGPEPAFYLDFVERSRFAAHRLVKNQIFAVNLGAGDALARDLPGYLGRWGEDPLRTRRPFRLLLRDRWATGQTSWFAVAWSEADLTALLAATDSTAIRRQYEEAVIDGLVRTAFSLGEEPEVSREVAREFGWTMRLTPGFFGAVDPRGAFVKFNATDPVRLILVHWMDEDLPLAPAAWDTVLGRVLRIYNDGDFVLAERTRSAPVTFQGQPALRWDGVWQNEKYVIGGPFRAFALRRGPRSFLLVGQVFAPGQDKVYALRQVEALMNTFRVLRP